MTAAEKLTLFNGHVPGQSHEDYIDSPGVSSSGIRVFLQKTPAHYKAYLEERDEPSDAMKLGTAVHMAILESARFDLTYICKPEGMSFATKEGKAWREANASKEILSFDDWQTVQGVRKAVARNSFLSTHLSKGDVEQSYYWTDEATGLLCKCRPDFFDGEHVFDIKTTTDASPLGFQRSIGKFGYHFQSAHYLDGLSQITGKTLTNFIHVCIETKPPYAVACYVLDDASLERAREVLDRGMLALKTCMNTNEWPGYPTEIQAMNLPSWLWSDNE